MNKADRNWLKTKMKYHPEWFNQREVLELGSGIVKGTVRRYFSNCNFVGVDYRDIEGVDVVCYAHQTKFKKEEFDILISFSMLEHDHYWKESLGHNIPFLKRGGIVMLGWGGPFNLPHGKEYSQKEGEVFCPKDLKEVEDYLISLNIDIIESSEEMATCGQQFKILGKKSIFTNKDLKFFSKNLLWRDDNGWRTNYDLAPCIIKKDNEIVSGCLLLSIDKVMILFHLFTLPEERGKGYATQVVKNAIEIFDKSKMTVLLAGTKRNILLRFFKNMGFKDISNPDDEDVVLCYQKNLKK